MRLAEGTAWSRTRELQSQALLLILTWLVFSIDIAAVATTPLSDLLLSSSLPSISTRSFTSYS